MDNNERAERVKKILVHEFELDEKDLKDDASLYEELGLDSLDSVDLIIALEKEFSFKIARDKDEEKIRAIRTLSDIHGFIEMKQNELEQPS